MDLSIKNMEWQKKRENEGKIFLVVTPSLDRYTDWDCSRSKPGARDSVFLSLVGARVQVLRLSFAVFSGEQWGAGLEAVHEGPELTF